jgi:hypothetical protein
LIILIILGEEDEMGGEKRNVYRLLVGKPEGKGH